MLIENNLTEIVRIVMVKNIETRTSCNSLDYGD